MTQLAYGTYIRVLDKDGTPRAGYAWQNFHQNETRSFNGNSYQFAGFAYSGGAIDLESASINATVVLSLNTLSLSIFQESVELFDLMEVNTVQLDTDNNFAESLYSSDIYNIIGMSHEGERLSVAFGSPLSAVGAETHRRLTTNLVGSLPPNGSLRIGG